MRDATIDHAARSAASARAAGEGRSLKVLIVVGHPRSDSLSQALADAYRDGARRAGAEVRQLALAGLTFDPNVRTREFAAQIVEDDLRRAQALIGWADHLVFVYPTWWGTMPALLKGFLDRVLAPGFAFEETANPGYVPLLAGKSAELLTTMDTPRWVWRWIYGAPGDRAMARAILGFCGIEMAQIACFGPIRGSSLEQRRAWLAAAEARGWSLRSGPFSRRQRLRRKVASWLRALRLQFYPMTWLAYSIGALAAARITDRFDGAAFWQGLLCLFFIEVATVLANEHYDFESDRRNANHGLFTGGSRVLVTGALSFGDLRRGIAAALTLALLGALWLVAGSGAGAGIVLLLLGAMTALALGYTVPPLKLSYRGLGELDVGITHSAGAILCGFVFQGGAWTAPEPWLLSLPLFLAVLPGITLSGVPDHDADRAVGKRTLAVRAGIRGAYGIAALCTVLAAAAALGAQQLSGLGNPFAGIEYGVAPHAALVLWLLARQARREPRATRIDRLMLASLSYTLWFIAVPLWHLA
ncbi:MAG TPA: NAD(P)H-dependent oxidoreductase [Geminicoccaceae bacterium]|nr:NAD(P)H-dependent oxidoreductase [Geminicoccaceae bacterium]